ncbi:MAG: prokaryotic E2 ligase family D protein [Prevotella sp.]|nr:prokaryotic E2 ligase family D protein [Prevotella sp.]
MVYTVKENGLPVYAYKDIKPSEATELFQTPFFNTSGAVCDAL